MIRYRYLNCVLCLCYFLLFLSIEEQTVFIKSILLKSFLVTWIDGQTNTKPHEVFSFSLHDDKHKRDSLKNKKDYEKEKLPTARRK